MKTAVAVCAVVVLSAVFLAAVQGEASADLIHFTRITSNAPANVADQLSADVSSVDATHVKFEFYNTAVIASSIADIYFDDGAADPSSLLDGITSIVDFGTLFGNGATPANLPAGNTLTPHSSADFSADSENQPPTLITNGVDQSTDNVALIFLLKPSKTLSDVLAALNNGTLRVGLHVQAIAGVSLDETDAGVNGGEVPCDFSDSFVNRPGPGGEIPEPGTLLLVGTGLLGALGCIRRRRMSA
jgi:hypothetical protein